MSGEFSMSTVDYSGFFTIQFMQFSMKYYYIQVSFEIDQSDIPVGFHQNTFLMVRERMLPKSRKCYVENYVSRRWISNWFWLTISWEKIDFEAKKNLIAVIEKMKVKSKEEILKIVVSREPLVSSYMRTNKGFY